jgi:cytochrome c biogenesis protein CcdA/thiol-disulfide isomerase/thioredoxin
MLLLLGFAFLAGIVTILSPCILPVLPIVLSGSVGGGHKKPLGIITGFVLSFTLFTLFLSAIVRLTGLSADALRVVSIVVILLFGISLLIPQIQILLERAFSRLSGRVSSQGTRQGYFGGVLIGLSLGLIWTPCVGPIIASVITLAATNSVNTAAFFITLAYALGTAIPMLVIMLGGRSLLNRVPWLLTRSEMIQKVFGVLMILTALAIYFQADRQFQTYILTTFPQYGTGLTKLEDNDTVKKNLQKVKEAKPDMDPLSLMGQQTYPPAPEIIPGGDWYNLPTGKPSLTIKELKGKVVLVDFWTYTCINCIRTLPYLKDWYTKYQDKGLVIIGVHTPEFEFEKTSDNVRKAIADFGLQYPIVQDNDYATWQAYSNQYWPAKYFIDKDGRIRSTHFGEGDYAESERTIQELLKETGSDVSDMPVNTHMYSVAANTPETYLGYGRMDHFVSPETVLQDKKGYYTIPVYHPASSFAYGGEWTIGKEYAQAGKKAELAFHYEAKDVYLVMRSGKKQATRVNVFLDSKPITAAQSGKDVKNGVITVTSDRLYHLVSMPGEEEHIVTLQFSDGNIEVYAFTFG